MTLIRRRTSIHQTRTQTQRAPLPYINTHTTTNPTCSAVDNDFNADFLLQFDHEQAWRNRDRPQMTDGEFATFLDRAKNTNSVARNWAPGTRYNVWTLDKKWQAYCRRYNFGDPDQALFATDRSIAMGFLTFMCQRCPINSTDTLWRNFRVWKQLYHHIVGEEFNAVDCADVYHFYKFEVIQAFRLKNSQARAKTVTDSSDPLAMLVHNIAYDKRILPDERVRLVIAACYFVLGHTGCRPAEIVDGTYSLSRITLVIILIPSWT